MGKKYWLALANLIWMGCWPAAMVQASEGQVVVSNAAMQHDWYQNSTAEQARRELELQLQEAVLAQLHPDFYTLWKKLQAKPADQRGALYDEAFGKLVLGRIDGFLGDVLATPWGLKEEGLSDLIVPHTMAVYEAPTFFMFSKKRLSPEFGSAFNRKLAEFKATNEYDIIWRRYAPAS